jgi:hypothetical protein
LPITVALGVITFRPTCKAVLFVLAAALWLGSAGTGLWVVWAWDNRPGTPAAPPPAWPENGVVRLASDRPTLVVLAHPQCVCTQATLTELAEVLARARVQPKTYILFMKPDGMPAGWSDTRLWRQAAALPGVVVIRDDAGRQARQFGAETSGQVVLYDANGALRFSGGITGARGHAGENVGRTALVGFLNESPAGNRTTPVFGCPLFAAAV